jgi:hypothetical protein
MRQIATKPLPTKKRRPPFRHICVMHNGESAPQEWERNFFAVLHCGNATRLLPECDEKMRVLSGPFGLGY